MLALVVTSAGFLSPSFGQFLPRPPRDPRPEQARTAFEGGRYREAAELYQEYLRKNPQNAEAWLFLGWSRYRLGDFSLAGEHFKRSLEAAPGSIDALVGLGYASLQTTGPEDASGHFLDALRIDPDRGDALRGLVLAGRRDDSPDWVIREGIKAARRLEEQEGKDVETLLSSETLRAGLERRLKADESPDRPIRSPWKTGPVYLERSTGDQQWQPVFIKGVNLSVALPGRFPSDYPADIKTYQEWMTTISDLGANAVRVYSLMPPAFYKALSQHNRNDPSRSLWLIQGIWFELPPENDLDDEGYESEIRNEIARVVDAVHGSLAIGPRPGRAWGSFDEDVSPWLLSFIIGRNWEPFAVDAYNEEHGHIRSWQGEWFSVESGTAMEVWIARLCDYTAGYQVRRFRTLNPLTFANWPSLDPIDHPTEATVREENEWRVQAGLAPIPDGPATWEDDAVSVDSMKIVPSEKNVAGLFASYQIYPSFPDFMNHQYSSGSDGKSSYSRYLADLKSHHAGQPVVVIEFGISTSRGIAHWHKGGRHHGGHDETEQGELLARMLREIRDERLAGGLIFSLMDEWSRTTWNTATFEIPSERGPLWFNVQSPDQSFGLLKQTPVSASIRIDGHSTDWSSVPPYAVD